MAQVIVRENESLESALKRFKRSCARDGVMAEVRKREHYEKPSVKRKKNLKLLEKRLRSTKRKYALETASVLMPFSIGGENYDIKRKIER